MIKYNKQHGFSLIELLIVMGLLAIVAIMTMDAFTVVLKQSSQTMKTVTTEIDQTIGLDILRSDIEQAGFGLPWTFKNSITYAEAALSPESTYNDSPSNAPRAILSGNNVGYNNSDYLVIKSTLVAGSDTANKWTYISKDTSATPTPKSWTSNNLNTNDKVIVIKPLYDATGSNELVMNSGTFYTTYSSSSFASAFSPATQGQRFIIYGVSAADTSLANLRMPFNRADYYIRRPSTGMPSDCAPNTGILYKATVNHGDGALTEMPILDCVADMQVVFRLNTDSNDITALTAAQIRGQVKEVRVYILFHEGSMDRSYTHGASTVTVGEFSLGSTFNLATTIGANWNRYRWRAITLAVKPKNIL
ncbi:MAG: prepilin-type N-terminal cleavage/methylation domain-containing protein [Proteobacteria bacterium]|nr:prepilin-type N-terminal cleavage/methylation domain-containing protein [Pseudomonadota bacterium]